MAKSALMVATLGLVAVLAVALAGCNPFALTRAASGDGSPSVLQCNQSMEGHGVDVVNMKVTCQASGAAAGDTSFQLHYSIKRNGASRTFDATCAGTLTNGAGGCTQTYALVVPFDDGPATISGEFLPSHKALGPMPLPQN
ncbi:MAG TPA: hypothetical protein VJO13_11730 [Ktedonobacterales bacterium]|nr:hypothetical protein [Ktedonobacterales bacterium]